MTAAESSTDEEVDGTPEKATDIIDRNDDAEESGTRMMENVKEIRVCDQAPKDTLIPTKTARAWSAVCLTTNGDRPWPLAGLKRTVQMPTGMYR